MSALQRLRSRLQQNSQLRERRAESDVSSTDHRPDSCGGQQREPLSTESSDGHADLEQSYTGDYTDTTACLDRMKLSGNRPEDWLEFLNSTQEAYQNKDDDKYTSYMTLLYARAKQAIDPELHKDSAVYGLLLIRHASCKSSVDDARAAYQYARTVVKRQAIVHIAGAQLELEQGDRTKAKRLLEKAKQLGAQPDQLITKAYNNLVYGGAELLSEGDKRDYVQSLTVKDSAFNEENRPAPVKLSSSSSGVGTKPLSNIQNILQPSSTQRPSDKSSDNAIYTDLLKPRSVNHGHRSTPDTPMESHGHQGVLDKAMESHGERIPSDITDENTGNQELFKKPMGRVSSLGSPPSSTEVTERTVSFLKPQRVRYVSGNTSDEADTIPLNLDADSGTYNRRSLKHYHSTPDCKTPGLLSLGRKPRNLGKPMRVKRSSLPQLQEGGLGELSDTDTFRMDPLPETEALSDTQPPKVSVADAEWLRAKVTRPAQGSKKAGLNTQEPEQEERMVEGSPVKPVLSGFPPSDADQDKDEARQDSEHSKDSGIHTQPLDVPVGGPAVEPSGGPPLEPGGNTQEPAANKSLLDRSATATGTTIKAGDQVTLVSKNPEPKQVNQVPAPVCQNSQPSAVPVAMVTQAAMATPGFQQPIINSQNMAQPNMVQPNMVQPMVQQGMMAPQMLQPSMMQPGMVQQGMMQPGMIHQGMVQPGMVQPGMCMFPTPSRQTEMITVNGNMYTVLRILGRGGSSKVYDTLDPNYNLRAVKVVNLDGADDATIKSYKNEIRLLKRLQHNSKIIKLYDFEFVEAANTLYVVMERGETDIATHLRRESKTGSIDSVMQKYYWKEMLKAVQVLHNEGIVHSDLKPANFVLVQGSLKLIDFGIANAIHQDMTSVTRDHQVGTLNYMSPEAILDTCGGKQLDDQGRVKPRIKIGVKSDVWSLGCILYNLVYGRTPFHSVSNQFLKLQAITNPKHCIEFSEDADPALRHVLMKCLVRDPKERPSIEMLLAYKY